MGKFQIKLLPNLTICLLITGMLLGSCKKKESETVDNRTDGAGPVVGGDGSIPDAFGGDIDLDNLPNYGNQSKPAYILKDNSDTNAIDDAKATIGRVFFYDKRLSIDNSISCGSCHQQAFGFSDTARVSTGVNGTTARHSMRLINARFGAERKFFWDERATSLEDQTTHPIKDQVEMGFSEATFNQLLSKLEKLGYYQELFYHVYGDIEITEERMQECLAMFIRSIQSFDSKYDQGRAGVANDQAPFPNFSDSENRGKNLFFGPPSFDGQGSRIAGGLGCGACHQGPEFDIGPNSRNNGLIRAVDGGMDEDMITRSPSLRDVFRPDGTLNGPLMHTGDFTFNDVLDHYNQISDNGNLDPRLRPAGRGQRLNITPQERDDIVAFMKTLTGANVYTDPKWSNPFE